jgi:hypothetical protein
MIQRLIELQKKQKTKAAWYFMATVKVLYQLVHHTSSTHLQFTASSIKL